MYYIMTLDVFRALQCLSSGGQIVYLQFLVLCHTVHRLRADCSPLSIGVLYGSSQRVTIPETANIHFDLLKMSIVMLETCRGS